MTAPAEHSDKVSALEAAALQNPEVRAAAAAAKTGDRSTLRQRPAPLVSPAPWYAPLDVDERIMLRGMFVEAVAGSGRDGGARKLCGFANRSTDHALYDSARGVLRELTDLHVDLCRAES